jgi:hypothetical protein
MHALYGVLAASMTVITVLGIPGADEFSRPIPVPSGFEMPPNPGKREAVIRCLGHCHLHIALEEKDTLSQILEVGHFHDGRAFEQHGQGRESLIIQVKMPVHVLMDRLQFVGHGFVKQIDALPSFHSMLH